MNYGYTSLSIRTRITMFTLKSEIIGDEGDFGIMFTITSDKLSFSFTDDPLSHEIKDRGVCELEFKNLSSNGPPSYFRIISDGDVLHCEFNFDGGAAKFTINLSNAEYQSLKICFDRAIAIKRQVLC